MLFTVERKWGVGSEPGFSWIRTSRPASNRSLHLAWSIVVVDPERVLDLMRSARRLLEALSRADKVSGWTLGPQGADALTLRWRVC